MPRKSTGKAKTSKVANRIPNFKSEAEEAEWWASRAGRGYASRHLAELGRPGKVITTEARTLAEAKSALDEAKRTGGAVLFKRGLDIKRTDPAVLERLMQSVKAKETQAISLRIPKADLDAAKAIGKKIGLGYQTVLKEIIHEGVKRAS